MSTILDDDLILGSPAEHFTADVLEFSKTYDIEIYRRLYGYISKNYRKIQGKMCWKKYSYIGITIPRRVDAWLEDKKHYGATPPKIIIASELLDKHDKKGWYTQCYVFKAIGKYGPKEKRSQWFTCYRDSQNPVLSSGWKFSEYEIYMVPDDDLEILYNFLPHYNKQPI